MRAFSAVPEAARSSPCLGAPLGRWHPLCTEGMLQWFQALGLSSSPVILWQEHPEMLLEPLPVAVVSVPRGCFFLWSQMLKKSLLPLGCCYSSPTSGCQRSCGVLWPSVPGAAQVGLTLSRELRTHWKCPISLAVKVTRTSHPLGKPEN
uniref:Uncharacterized protein n=1 Tax=Meleagris gallopavo TaxID=9103 RepID=A0A803YLA6_MELGA